MRVIKLNRNQNSQKRNLNQSDVSDNDDLKLPRPMSPRINHNDMKDNVHSKRYQSQIQGRNKKAQSVVTDQTTTKLPNIYKKTN